jgi:hypothetical protein
MGLRAAKGAFPVKNAFRKPMKRGLEAGADRERKPFIDDLLVRIHLIVEMVWKGRPCAIGV